MIPDVFHVSLYSVVFQKKPFKGFKKTEENAFNSFNSQVSDTRITNAEILRRINGAQVN